MNPTCATTADHINIHILAILVYLSNYVVLSVIMKLFHSLCNILQKCQWQFRFSLATYYCISLMKFWVMGEQTNSYVLVLWAEVLSSHNLFETGTIFWLPGPESHMHIDFFSSKSFSRSISDCCLQSWCDLVEVISCERVR